MSMRDIITNLRDKHIQLQSGDSTRLTINGYFIARELFIQLVEGIDFLHQRDRPVVHLDLKPENILISFDHNTHFVKIADFGNALNESDRDLPTHRGTHGYIAPELSAGRFDRRSDLYSLGKIAQELFYFNPKEDTEFYEEIKNVVTLIQRLKSRNPVDRGSCAQILELRRDLLRANATETTLREFIEQ